MASKVRKRRNTPAMPVLFGKFAIEHKLSLPLLVRVTNSEEPDIPCGSVLRLNYVQEKYKAEYVDPITHHKIRVEVPPDFGALKTVSQHPPNHVYTSIEEIALDFPSSVRVLENVKLQGTLAKCGERLELVETQTIGKDRYLICLHYPSHKQLQVPYKLRGKFRRQNDNATYTAEQLTNRIPVLVQREINIGRTIRHSDVQMFKSIPADFEGVMSLTMAGVVEVEHWHLPTPAKIFNGTGKRDRILNLNCGISVASADDLEKQFGPVENLIDVAKRAKEGKPTIAMVCGDPSQLKPLEIRPGVIVAIYGSVRKEGVVASGTNSNIVVPKDYNKSALFKIKENEYSTTLAKRTKIANDVDYELVNFNDPSPIVSAHSMSDILQLGTLPMNIEPYFESLAELSDDEMYLINESPLTLLEECSYLVANVAVFETSSRQQPQAIEVPDFMDIRVRKAHKLPSDKTAVRSYQKLCQKPKSRIFQLSAEHYYRLIGVPITESAYAEILSPFVPKIGSRHLSTTTPSSTVKQTSPDKLSSLPTKSPSQAPSNKLPKPPELPSGSPRLPRCSTDSLYQNCQNNVKPTTRPNEGLKELPVSDSEQRQPLALLLSQSEEEHVYTELTKDGDHEVPFEMSDETVPVVPPPPDGIITEFDVMQLAGLMRYLELGHSAVANCVHHQIDGRKVTDMFQSMTEQSIRQELKLGRMSDVYSLRHFVERKLAKTVPDVEPPEDGDISRFGVREVAGLMRHLGFKEESISICLTKQIDGMALCRMNNESVKSELRLKTSDPRLYALQHFILRSQSSKTISDVEPPEDGDISKFSVRELAGLMQHFGFSEETISICLAEQISGMTLCHMDVEAVQTELKLKDSELYALQHFISSSK